MRFYSSSIIFLIPGKLIRGRKDLNGLLAFLNRDSADIGKSRDGSIYYAVGIGQGKHSDPN
jgi:hypothetical protein